MKYINFKRYKFSTVTKNIKNVGYNFLKIFNFIDFKRYEFRKLYKRLSIYDFRKFHRYLNIKVISSFKITKYLNIKIYKNIFKKITLSSNKFLFIHLPASFVFFIFLYLLIPSFYNYDKLLIENIICNKQEFFCQIKGKINYSFYPTPRIKIKKLIISNATNKKNTFINSEDVEIKLSIKNLLAKDKHKYKKIKFSNYEIKINLKKLKDYKKNKNTIPLSFSKGSILFFSGKNYVATINNAFFNLDFNKENLESELKGNFLNDNININFKRENIDNKKSSNFVLRMSKLKFITKINIPDLKKDKFEGNILIKKDKNKIAGIFIYKDGKLIINKSNLRNSFIDGKLEGKIELLPYFDFDLDINLNSINFTKLYNYFLSLDAEGKKKLFKINNKINGNLILSADKVYSKYNLIKSFESRIKFNNSNILVEQFLLNLGKLGAADFLGSVNNNKKNTNFKFESNVFVDNEKKFLSKFGIYKKKKIHPSLFISGNFDLDSSKMTFYEIENNEKLSNEDVSYIENEFNNLMFENDYESLFDFSKFKEFIKSIQIENN